MTGATRGDRSLVVVGRVALTGAATQALVAGLNQFLEEQRLGPSKAMASGTTFQ